MATYEVYEVGILPGRDEVTVALRVTSGRRKGDLDNVRLTETVLREQAGDTAWNALRELVRASAEAVLHTDDLTATVSLYTPPTP